jgi:23S rRNA (cytidine1920-2'-O)/16S rRNA (cytidine1409-2'-O)-methyltransferase
MARRRADQLLVAQGLVSSRARAQALILAGAVLQGDSRLVCKPGERINENEPLRLRAEPQRYVSRGGLKLEAALKHFGVEVSGLSCLDIGASTGGFTDCLLQAGARHVWAVDVGYGQLDYRLRQDSRVSVVERANIRYLSAEALTERVAIVVVDVSFISLRLVLPNVPRFAQAGAIVIALIKPQFEVGRGDVAKGGIVKSQAARERALATIVDFVTGMGWKIMGTKESPILGADGNLEYLLCARYAERTNFS